MFFSESPNFDMEVCPICDNVDILESKKDRESQQHQVYFDNIEEKFYKNYDRKVKFYQIITNKDPFFVCNNPSCVRKSFEENKENYKKPKKIDKFENLPNKKEENKKWRNSKKNKIQESFKKNKL